MHPETSSLPSEVLPTGATVDRYVIEGLLGVGGMSVVYLARHAQLDTRHALKLMTSGGRRLQARLLAEGRVQARLRHPNVVPVSDVVEHDGQPGLVLEYVRGVPLDSLLESRDLSRAERDGIARGILAGVSFAHANGVIHRDLKPGNVMVGDDLIPRIMDFGLVKLVQSSEGTGPVTRAGATMGTPHYMAPEQFTDASSVDFRADVFSLGALLYELATGTRAFGSGATSEIFARVMRGAYTPPRELVPDLPLAWERAIVGALAVDRGVRIATVDQLLATWTGADARSADSGLFDTLAPGARSAGASPQRRSLRAPIAAAVSAIAFAGAWLLWPVPDPAAHPTPQPAPAAVAVAHEVAPAAPPVAAVEPSPAPQPEPEPARPTRRAIAPEPPPPAELVASAARFDEPGAAAVAPPIAPAPVPDSWVRGTGALVSSDGTRFELPGPVPAGRYAAWIDGIDRGTVTVRPDALVTLACDDARCTVR